MATSETLRPILDEATEKLEQSLQTNYAPALSKELQLRNSACRIVTAAVQEYLRRHHDIETTRHITTSELAPRELNSRRLSHVVLRHEGVVIDPTYSQFMIYSGLSPLDVMEDETLHDMYPHPKIAIFDVDNSEQFAGEFARHMYDQAPEVKKRIGSTRSIRPSAESLKNASPEEIQSVFRDIWSPENYTVHDGDQSLSQLASKIVDDMQAQDSKH